MTDDKQVREFGEIFMPRFDAHGLITAIAIDAATNAPLMVAHMNDEALALTLKTGIAHYWSRSRGKLWKKGETSGQIQTVTEMLTDCDQDAVILKVTVGGDGASCHNGFRSCFYRRIDAGDGTPDEARLERIDTPLVDPDTLYSR